MNDGNGRMNGGNGRMNDGNGRMNGGNGRMTGLEEDSPESELTSMRGPPHLGKFLSLIERTFRPNDS